MKKTIAVFALLVLGVTVLDYMNIPSLLGLYVSNMNWGFYAGFLNAVVVLAVFAITYKVLTEREIKIHNKELLREENKLGISLLLVRGCYEECKSYIDLLSEETVNNHIVPKIDFNSINPRIIGNLRIAPFSSENIILDLAKDGQITEEQIAGYFKVRRKYEEYVNMRITFFDAPHFYIPLREEFLRLLNAEIEEVTCFARGQNNS